MDTEIVENRRIEAAELVQTQRATIMRRIHSILGSNARKIADTEDVLSTATRRVDKAIYDGRLKAASNAEFYAFVHGVIERVILEKARSSQRTKHRELTAQKMHSSSIKSTPLKRVIVKEDVDRVGRVISNPVDREIVLLRGRGLKLSEIAKTMGLESGTVRQRWTRMRAKIGKIIVEDLRREEHE